MLHYVLEDTPQEGELKSNTTELRLSLADVVEIDPGLLVPSHSALEGIYAGGGGDGVV